jgi:hypothetical protein
MTRRKPEIAHAAEGSVSAPADLALSAGWALSFQRQESGVKLTLMHPEQSSFAFEIAITAAGPVVRASAAALHLDASDEIVARCDRFAVEARREVSITSPSVRIEAAELLSAQAPSVELTATLGDMRLWANDDMKLLGERVLLNCEGEPPLPAWLPEQPAEVLLPRQDASGELAVAGSGQPESQEEA